MTNVIMPSVVMMNIVMLGIVMTYVVTLGIFMTYIVMLSVVIANIAILGVLAPFRKILQDFTAILIFVSESWRKTLRFSTRIGSYLYY
jgi:hypothetical protein